MGLIHEKNQRPKISCYCTFKKLFLKYINISGTTMKKSILKIKSSSTKSTDLIF
jgi:hypothetical protein